MHGFQRQLERGPKPVSQRSFNEQSPPTNSLANFPCPSHNFFPIVKANISGNDGERKKRNVETIFDIPMHCDARKQNVFSERLVKNQSCQRKLSNERAV